MPDRLTVARDVFPLNMELGTGPLNWLDAKLIVTMLPMLAKKLLASVPLKPLFASVKLVKAVMALIDDGKEPVNKLYCIFKVVREVKGEKTSGRLLIMPKLFRAI